MLRHLPADAVRTLVLISAPFTLVATARAAAPCTQGSQLAIEVSGLKDRTGRIIAELYPATPADFLEPKDKLLNDGKVFRRSVAAIGPSGAVGICLRAPGPGTYALVVIHDRDGLDKFSFSKDGAGLPVARSIGFARPRLQNAVVTVGSSPRTVPVTMQYMKGIRGFVLASR
jgi:uncharacterized protein (DUF2141 family)